MPEQLKNEFTATGYIVNKERSKMLLIHHNKINTWLPPGGHMDANELPHECVLRETKEEIGIDVILINNTFLDNFVSDTEKELPLPICIFHEIIQPHKEKPKHMHIDFVYLCEAKEGKAKPLLKEISAIKWFTRDEILASNTFPSIKTFAQKILQ